MPAQARKLAAGFFLAAYFLAFTWRGIFVYFSGDDVTNLYRAWKPPLADLLRANLFYWSPFYRPLGSAVYRLSYSIFGLHPRPLGIFYYAVLLLNLWLAYKVFEKIARSEEIALLATLIFSVHASFGYLYYNFGVLYDALCFTFFFAALWLYLEPRQRGEQLSWPRIAAIVALYVCSLNSKETAAALPVVLFLYEGIFLKQRSWWFAVLLSLLTIPYVYGKLGPGGLTTSPAYVPHISLNAWLSSTAQYFAYLAYLPHPVSAGAVAALCALLASIALLLRSRVLGFGLMFFFVTLLPVSFVSTRLGFVLYLPFAGLALYAASLLVQAKDRLSLPQAARVPSFLLIAAALAWANARHWDTPHDPSPVRITVNQFKARGLDIHPGARFLFVKDAFGSTYEILYTLSLLYQERELTVTPYQGPADLQSRYDYIFTYERGRYLEMDHADAARTVRLNILLDEKTRKPAGGEMLVVGHPDQWAYYVDGVLTGEPTANSYWTVAAPHLKFLLKPAVQYAFTCHFYLPGQTFEKTGPVTIRYFIGDHPLDRVTFSSPGEYRFRHEASVAWIEPQDFTVVKMEVENPYIAPADGAKLGFLLLSAGFEAVP